MQQLIVFYIVTANLLGLWLMGSDKQKARKKQWRIREKTLWTVAVIGGAIGMTIGMFLFRHKTKHLAFLFGFPLLSILDLALIYFFRGHILVTDPVLFPN